ncbi:MAG: ammonia-forming cytochrome c nitrite reductase subunit c552 [Deltaproteobacteria bacterium]|nr:ammonia-forming cytochrome c nitrite reductase subunit c552 [Deltaproteobacteria bacterium]
MKRFLPFTVAVSLFLFQCGAEDKAAPDDIPLKEFLESAEPDAVEETAGEEMEETKDVPGEEAEEKEEKCSTCHDVKVKKLSESRHAGLNGGCLTCHANGLDHQEDPSGTPAKVDFSIELCGTCHGGYKDSYLKDDGLKAGKYGGSVKTSKYDEFPHYIHLMGGHGFTKEYNEERAHKYILKDHIEIKRKQNVVCLQCKSTPLAYYWNEQRRGETVFGKDYAWDAAVEKIKANWGETIDYGASCSHCHDPHTTGFRVIRKAMISAILERGTDPYTPEMTVYPKNPADLEKKMNEKGQDGKLTSGARRLAGTLTCAQCHVEYVCGPGIDKDLGILRDDFPWRKLKDIEDYYSTKFNLMQDWKHSGTGLPGIKPQHPEVEFFWGGKHHTSGLSCADCHMAGGGGKTDHWLTSPLKQPAVTCGKCHGNPEKKIAETIEKQDEIFAKAKEVVELLDAVLLKIEAGAEGLSQDEFEEAKESFMRGLMWWEWTIVSENSTGIHNTAEAHENLENALTFAAAADSLLK